MLTADLPAPCQDCKLCLPAIEKGLPGWLVSGEGNPDAQIILVGEALGETEERQARPFVGDAGACLNASILDAGLLRANLWITNAVRCRPRNAADRNRAPKPKELAYCRPFLDEELAKRTQKQVIVAMGASAMWAIFHPALPPGGVNQNEGRVLWSTRHQCWVVCTIHPSYALRKPAEREFLVDALAKAARIAASGHQETPPVVAYTLVRDFETAEQVKAHALRAAKIYFDWETNGLHLTQSIGFCLALCLVDADGTKTVYVIPRFGAGMLPFWGKALRRLDQEILTPILLASAEKGGHHVSFDQHMTYNTLGIWPRRVTTCTMLKSHLLDNHFPERAHGLKRLSDRLTPYGRYDEAIDDWLLQHGYTVKDQKGGVKPDWNYVWMIPNAILWPYAATDALVTALVDEPLDVRLHEEKLVTLYHEERMPSLFEYIMIDRTGLRIDEGKLDSLGQDLDGIMDGLGNRISQMAGRDLNPNSHPQVADYLFNALDLPVVKTTDTGAPSVAEEVLLQLAPVAPIATLILHYRAYGKLKTTFVDGNRQMVGGLKAAIDADGRARLNTIFIAAETFRFATRKPFPIHVIPRPLDLWNCAEHGIYQYDRCCASAIPTVLSLRGLIIPDDGWVFLSRDFSQQEFAIQSVAAGQQDLEEAIFDRGEDAHEYVMERMFGKTATSFGGVKNATGKYDFPDEHSAAGYKNFRADAKCVDPDMRVLMADLRWERAGNLEVGDQIVGFDEEAPGPRARRRYCRSVVTNAGRAMLESVEVVTDRGKVIVSADHQFLCGWRKGRRSKAYWAKASELSSGDRIVYFAEPWMVDRTYDAGRLAGFLEGEGSVCGSARSDPGVGGLHVSFAQNCGPLADAVVNLLQDRNVRYTSYVGHPKAKPVLYVQIPAYEALRLLGMVRPERLLKRADELWWGLTATASRGPKHAHVLSVNPLGRREVVTVGTTSQTLVVEGLLSHNSTNFAALFRAQSKKLGKMIKKSPEEAALLMEIYNQKFQKIRAWQYATIMTLRETGRVTGLYGTYRKLPGIYSPNKMTQYEAERQACNFPIQEGGFRYMIRALIRIGRRFRGGRAPWQKADFPARVAFSVHDEIVVTAREDVAEEADAIAKDEMERPQVELTGACGIPRGIRSDGGKALHAWG